MLSYNTDDSDVNMVVPCKQLTQRHQVTKISWLHKVGTKKIGTFQQTEHAGNREESETSHIAMANVPLLNLKSALRF